MNRLDGDRGFIFDCKLLLRLCCVLMLAADGTISLCRVAVNSLSFGDLGCSQKIDGQNKLASLLLGFFEQHSEESKVVMVVEIVVLNLADLCVE